MTDASNPNRTEREQIASPCVKICVIHPETRLCAGCARSLDEIASWTRMSAEERSAVLAELPTRRVAHFTKRRGGRAGRLARRGGDS
ncbi:MAG: DUF1289 domain-containing protein [Rhodobacteraceae bacterium]|nr:DUF1289 domain-containing protein [Paracoccaceae bacterium]